MRKLTTVIAKSINVNNFRKLIKDFSGEVLVNSGFSFIVFEILLLESRTVLSPAKRSTGSERVNVSLKNQNSFWILLKLLKR